MGMTIDELKCIIGEYKLRIPPTVYYELLADLEDAEFISKADYENRLKAEKIAMLEELQSEIEELYPKARKTYRDGLTSYCEGVDDSREVIQQKINALKGDSND